MSKKINNRILLIVLLGLVAVLVLTRLLTYKRSVRTLDTELVGIDTAAVTSMILYPKAEHGSKLVFDRNGTNWTVSKDERSASADASAVRRSLAALLNMKTERLVSRAKDKWSDYSVNDSLGTRVEIREGKKKTLDLVLGRFDYKPPPGGYQGYGQNQVTGVTYVRKAGQNEVYAVEGFLGMNFNQNFNTWRNQNLLNLSTSKLSKIVYDYPADSGFIAQKSANGWMVAGLSADSTAMAKFLSSISRKRSSEFVDDYKPPASPDYQVTFEGENMTPIQIKAYRRGENDFILNSSINPESWFHSQGQGLFSQLFKRPGELLGQGKDE